MAPNLEQQLDSAAQQEKVEQILSSLPETYALALIWRYRDEKSVREPTCISQVSMVLQAAAENLAID